MEPSNTGLLASPSARLCKKCNAQEATLTLRSQPSCKECYSKNLGAKFSKQLGVLGRDLGPVQPSWTRRLLIGLSLGVSSSALVDLLHVYVTNLMAMARRVSFEITVVFVDTENQGPGSSRGAQALEKFRERYPLFAFQHVPLVKVIGLPTIDWSSLPNMDAEKAPAEQLRHLFDQLSSTTSRTDTLRQFVRHILVSVAVGHSCQAILLGSSTTALAELTLSETAKGRGFSLRWQTNDGLMPIPDAHKATVLATEEGSSSDAEIRNGKKNIHVYHPLRDILRKELATYATLKSPPLTDLIPDSMGHTGPVVSHKDVSIEEIMVRYFAEVEEGYPSVVANVVRTMGKLSLLDAVATCGLCAMPIDEEGNERWRGEIGDHGDDLAEVSQNGLCYGCQRSMRGQRS